jgi:hypothetical protein
MRPGAPVWQRGGGPTGSRPVRKPGPAVEELETRLVPAVNVLTFHNDIASTGLNPNEVQLTPANVRVGSFAKLFTTPLDGQAYAQPLVDTGVTITDGPHTRPGAAGVHDVVFVATEHDSLYAIDASATGGAVLWQRSFLDTTDPTDNTLGATAITAVPAGDVDTSSDPNITPEVGITGTPVIDPASNTLYVVAKTEETIQGATHVVQRLHAVNLGDGTDRVAPFLIGDTTAGNTNNTPVYVYGSGDGSVTDPYNGTGQAVVQFNALRENQRGALSLVSHTVYVEWASHADFGPYHGWVAAWDVSNLAGGLRLKGVFNTSPNGGLSGIWQGGGRLAFEADGSAFYFETGNGAGYGGDPTLDANGFPADGDYYEALLKVVPDPTTDPTHQNRNGWGLKVADYFIPYNQAALDSADLDFGSGAPLVLPDSAGIPRHPHLLVAAGKEGKIYLVDRDNLGKYDPAGDHVLNAVPDGSGHNTPPVQLGGALSTAAYFNGTIYWTSGYDEHAYALAINADGTLSVISQTASTFGYLPGSAVVSANGTTAGIAWLMDRNANAIRAYDAGTLGTELWDSDQRAGGADAVGAVVKFAVPTVANGQVYVGTLDGLVVYGLASSANQVPDAPTLSAADLSDTSVRLTWTDTTAPPNTATGYSVEQSADGTTFTLLTTAPAGSTALNVGGLAPGTTYYFRIRGFNGVGNSAYSNVASATTSSSGTQAPAAPSGLGAVPASAASVSLSWTNNATNQTGFHLDRATDAAFTQNLITQDLPATPDTFTDTASGLAPGRTFYYRLRAFNAAGDSANSDVATVTIPLAPPTPTNARVTAITTSEIDLSWTDNAGSAATGYEILRKAGSGAFVSYATLPPASQAPPSTYTWRDTGVSPGTFYEYHIRAFNVSGNNDFAGINATTITAPPGDLTAALGGGAVALAWSAPAGAVSYNVYRGTASGGEMLYQQGVPGTSFVDRNVAAGTTYYYRVSAVNANGARVPPLPGESAPSAEASATVPGQAPAPPPAIGEAADVSALVRVRRGNRLRRGRGRSVQVVTLRNRSGQALAGPLALVLDGLGRQVQLLNRTGVTRVHAPSGSPYLDIDGGLAPGASLRVRLTFFAPGQGAIHFGARVLAGAGPR